MVVKLIFMDRCDRNITRKCIYSKYVCRRLPKYPTKENLGLFIKYENEGPQIVAVV